ncbi:MAG TPA: TonB-dependent receptor [Flavisolibacter sp.]
MRAACFFSILVFHCSVPFTSWAQETDTATQLLPGVLIRAFEQNRELKNTPAAVNYVGKKLLGQFSNASIVHAVNATPGVRMEERSPGSYRFNIRGSSLRSPFGVRNVKVYFNDIPITDPGGHTYLNQLGYYNFNSIEIIKGPGSSVYGAGTGGVLLVQAMPENEPPNAFAEYARGSYGLSNLYGSLTTGNERHVSRIGLQRQRSDGYRNHSELERDVHTWNGLFKLDDKRVLRTTFLYGELFYETPGALTAAEYEDNPRLARPGGFGFPGAEESAASISQKTFISGASYQQQLSATWMNKSTLYGMFTELRNPTVRNYGKSSEPHLGGRTMFRYSKGPVVLDAGGEWQEGFTSVSIHKNTGGLPDSIQVSDEISNRQQFVFVQGAFELSDWTLTASASSNYLRVKTQRFTPATSGAQERKFTNEITPRVSLMKKWPALTAYASVAKGFSPPTTAELLPTGGAINLGLDAEEGVNYDLGLRLREGGVFVDINAFYFRLQNMIVLRRDAGGGDFFINAGKTRQYGVETQVTCSLFDKGPWQQSQAWASHTWHRFRYREFVQVNNDFSGNSIPDVAPHVIAGGVDLVSAAGFLGSLTYYFNDQMPLNDANTAHASSFHLIGIRGGWQQWMKGGFRLKLVAGVENLLDERYSLGNDINGFGGRYYNAAAARNYYASVIVQWLYR